MDSSRRAVESYWRSRMIDGTTSDEDKVTPVYKLEEICELLRSSHSSIVRELSEFVLKRLEHKSPIVKQKTLRLIKYAIGKSGVEFRREMQRHSVAVRQLIHYKGQMDPLKGDALNKAVRETAQEALSAMFTSDDNKPSPSEELSKRIEGFGNTNFEMPVEDKKSFLSEVVGLGGATIMQGLSNLTNGQSLQKNDTGSYKSPALRRSLTTETGFVDRYEGGQHNETHYTSRFTKNVTGGTWGPDLRSAHTETTIQETGSSYTENKTREERLLETIVTSGGVRLQPTRDALQVFLVEASKLDGIALSHAIELKLQSSLWQVRMKAVCVLEAILRKGGDGPFSIVKSYFSDDKDFVLKCSESPQASLREKANKVLNLLGGEHTSGGAGHHTVLVKTVTNSVQLPDLIDAGDPDDQYVMEESIKTLHDQNIGNLTTKTPLIDDLFGDSLSTGASTNEQNKDEDPFADVSFHPDNNKEQIADLFSGMNVGKTGTSEVQMEVNKNGAELFDIFGPNSEVLPQQQESHKNNVNDLISDLSINGTDELGKQNGIFFDAPSQTVTAAAMNPGLQVTNDPLNAIHGSHVAGLNLNPMLPMGPMAYSLPPGIMFNQAFTSQPMNYGTMGSLLAQQQLLQTMSNFQHLQSQNDRLSHIIGTKVGEYSSPLPDIFNPSIQTQPPISTMDTSKKEDTKAFDFISDHLAASRDPRRVV